MSEDHCGCHIQINCSCTHVFLVLLDALMDIQMAGFFDVHGPDRQKIEAQFLSFVSIT